MKRRDLMIAMAAVPLARAFGLNSNVLNNSGAGCSQMKFGELRIILDGPFALVLKSDLFGNITAVMAFAPTEPKDAHHFFLNGVEYQHTSKSYHFSLIETNTNGLNPPSFPEYIDQGFGDFYVSDRTKFKDLNDYFIYMDLPCPNRIVFTGNPAMVTLKKDAQHTPRQMPTNHILLYDVALRTTEFP